MSPPETWAAWATRVGGELAHLSEADGLTVTVRVSPPAPSPYAAERAPRRWRRSGGRPASQAATRAAAQARVPDVLVQARLVEGSFALECISDTEFEGLSDLTRDEVATLAELGWERDGGESELSRVFDGGRGGQEAAAREAAELLRESLAGVLGAASPDDVDLRRATRH